MSDRPTCPNCGGELAPGSPRTSAHAAFCGWRWRTTRRVKTAPPGRRRPSPRSPRWRRPRIARHHLRFRAARPAPRHGAGRNALADGPAVFARDARRVDPAPALRRDRPGRHGRRAQGPRPRPRPRPGRQGAARKASRQPRPGAPVRRGGPDRRPVAAPGRRAGLRAGAVRRPPAVFLDEAGQGPHPGRGCSRSGRTRADDLLGAPRDPGADLPDGGLRARPRGDPPRPEAVERDGRLLRRGPGDGLGPGQGPAAGRGRSTTPRPASSTAGDGDRHGPERRLDGDLSRAGSVLGTPAYMAPEQARGEIERRRRAGRRLRPGLDPLRDPHGPAGVRRPDRRRDPAQGGAGRPGRRAGPARRLRGRRRADRAGEGLPGRRARRPPAATPGRSRRGSPPTWPACRSSCGGPSWSASRSGAGGG